MLKKGIRAVKKTINGGRKLAKKKSVKAAEIQDALQQNYRERNITGLFNNNQQGVGTIKPWNTPLKGETAVSAPWYTYNYVTPPSNSANYRALDELARLRTKKHGGVYNPNNLPAVIQNPTARGNRVREAVSRIANTIKGVRIPTMSQNTANFLNVAVPALATGYAIDEIQNRHQDGEPVAYDPYESQPSSRTVVKKKPARNKPAESTLQDQFNAITRDIESTSRMNNYLISNLPSEYSASQPSSRTVGKGGHLRKPITGKSYTVQYGDTLSNIARRAGMSVKEIAELNGITDVNKIMTGQKLKLENAATRAAVKRALAQQINDYIANNIGAEDAQAQAAELQSARQAYLQDQMQAALQSSIQNYQPDYEDEYDYAPQINNNTVWFGDGTQRTANWMDQYMYQ